MKDIENNKGFTLLEVIISLAILAMAFVAILGIRDRSIRAAVEAERLTKAALTATRIMGEVELEDLDENMKEGVDKGFRWVVTKNPSPIETLKELRLVLWWDEEKVMEVVEYIP